MKAHTLMQAIEAAEDHLRDLGFDSGRLSGAKGFDRIQALRDAVEALYTSDDRIAGLQDRRGRTTLSIYSI